MAKKQKPKADDGQDQNCGDEDPESNKGNLYEAKFFFFAVETTDPEENLDVFEIIGVQRTATQQEIKKAYYKLALRLHPDKNPGDEEAKEKFQLLQRVISILGDEEKRAFYDQTGCVEDVDLGVDILRDLCEYFRTIYKKVTEADSEEFEANYRGSDTEKKDLKDLYKEFKGHMNRLFCSMICSERKLDSHRFKNIIDEGIAAGELKETRAYRKWANEVSRIEPPTNPLKRRRKSDKGAMTNLIAAISQRRSERREQSESIFSSMITKCGKGEPSDRPSVKERKRIEGRKAKKAKTEE